MFVKSMTWYIEPAAPCAMPTVAFRYRVAQAVPAAPGLPGEDEAAADPADVGAAEDAGDAGAAADGDDATAEDGASVWLDAEDDKDEHPVAKAAAAIKPAVPVSVSMVRCSVIVAPSSLRSPSGSAESHRCGIVAVPRVPRGPDNL